MVVLYLDSSAFVKLYVAEAGSPAVRGAVQRADRIACHLIGHGEIRAALASAQRSGRLSADHGRQRDQFLRDWNEGDLITTDEPLVLRAGELAEGFALRGYDAVHLAAAERLFRVLGSDVRMSTFDTQLGRASRLLGLAPA